MSTGNNQVWEVIDLVIKENIKPNEAIKNFGAHGDFTILYSAILENKLVESRYDGHAFDLFTRISVPTLRDTIKELINDLRERAD